MAEYIEREAVNALIKAECSPKVAAYLIDAVATVPAADVRPVVRGEWGYRWKIHGDGRRPTELFPCSECGYENTSSTHYCPNCGADMREEQDGR